jgi:hypothetical protein
MASVYASDNNGNRLAHQRRSSGCPRLSKLVLRAKMTIRCVDNLQIAPAERQKIYEDNARRLLKLPKK